jgi:DNA-binding response OmpR family regulator
MSTILIFDSSAVTCHTVSKQLRTYGFDTTQARSISGARVALAAKPIDLVILELAAPDAGGVTLLRELQRDGTWQKVPVVVLTSSMRDSDRIDARAAGAAAFLAKPVSTRELLFTVNTALASALAPQGASRQGEYDAANMAPNPASRFPHRRDMRAEWAPAAAAPPSQSVL